MSCPNNVIERKEPYTENGAKNGIVQKSFNHKIGAKKGKCFIDAKSRMLVTTLRDYFAKERDTLSPGFDPDDTIGRTACALKLDTKTVKDIIDGKFNGCDNLDKDSDSDEGRGLIPDETTDWNDIDCIKVEAIRQVLRSITLQSEVITRKKMIRSLKKNNLMPIHRSISCVLSHMGYYWKECLTQHILFERDDFVSKRCKFLRKMEDKDINKVIWVGITCLYSTCVNKVSYIPSKRDSINRGGRILVMHAGCSKGWIDGAKSVNISKKAIPYLDEIGTKGFLDWFEKLMEYLPSSSIIVMEDNYCTIEELDKAPKEYNTREEILHWLNKQNIWMNNNGEEFSKAELLGIVSETKPFYPLYVIDELATKFGHEVVRIPEYHGHFNPIEKIFLRIQKQVEARAEASGGLSITDMEAQTNTALTSIRPKDWAEAVNQVGKIIDKYQEQEPKLQEAVEAIISNIVKLKKSGHAFLTQDGIFEKQAISDDSDAEYSSTHSKRVRANKGTDSEDIQQFFEQALAVKKEEAKKKVKPDVITQAEIAEDEAAKQLIAMQRKSLKNAEKIEAAINAAKLSMARSPIPIKPKLEINIDTSFASKKLNIHQRNLAPQPRITKQIIRTCEIKLPVKRKINIPAQYNVVQPSIIRLPPGAPIPSGYVKFNAQSHQYLITNLPSTSKSTNSLQLSNKSQDSVATGGRLLLPKTNTQTVTTLNGIYQVVNKTDLPKNIYNLKSVTKLPSNYLNMDMKETIKIEPLDHDYN